MNEPTGEDMNRDANRRRFLLLALGEVAVNKLYDKLTKMGESIISIDWNTRLIVTTKIKVSQYLFPRTEVLDYQRTFDSSIIVFGITGTLLCTPWILTRSHKTTNITSLSRSIIRRTLKFYKTRVLCNSYRVKQFFGALLVVPAPSTISL